MGDISDYYRDYEDEFDKPKEIYWTTVSGAKINIRDLTPEHKENIRNMLKRTDREAKKKWLKILKK